MRKLVFESLGIAVLGLAQLAPAVALDTNRPEVRAFIDEVTRDYGFERETVQRLLAQAETKQPILDAMSRPAERVVPWHEYRERFLTPLRTEQGAAFWREHETQLDRIKDPGIAAAVVGILGVETSYGRTTGRYRVLDALATLGFDYPPRAEFFRSELKEFLLLTREEAVDPATAIGSYAGAMGAPQFISSSYRKFAVDGNADGKRDLWSSWDDVIGSIANYLTVHGWRSGEPVVVPATFDKSDLEPYYGRQIELNETVGSLRDKGVHFETTLPKQAPAMLIVSQGKEAIEYRVGFTNFYAITRYNRSTMYALAVYELGKAARVQLAASEP